MLLGRWGERVGLSRRAVEADIRGFGYPYDRVCVGSGRRSRIERHPEGLLIAVSRVLVARARRAHLTVILVRVD